MQRTNYSPASSKGQLAFLTIWNGGTGAKAAQHARALYQADGEPFPAFNVRVDTDPDPSPGFDMAIPIGLDAEKLETLTMNSALFGPTADTIIRSHPKLMDPEDAANGSRTIRLLTQLAFIYHEDYLLRKLHEAIRSLYKKGGFENIAPYFVSSSGGGAGGALQILLAQRFADPAFRARLMEGLHGLRLLTPVSLVVEPFAYSVACRNSQADMILANAMAFRIESAELERQRALKYVIHLGLANENGVVLDTPQDIARVLGISLYQFQRNWLSIKSFLVNNVDTNRIVRSYSGIDTPERVQANGKAHTS